ncbi:MAG: NADH-quinone oxidoreductase subunit L [Candidatus Bathyarchaeia archaeon]
MTTFYAEWLVWALPFIAIPFTLALSRWPKVRNWFAATITGLTFLLAIDLLLEVQSGRIIDSSISWLSVYSFQVKVHVDGLAAFLAVVVNSLGFLIVVYSQGYMGHEKGLPRYYSLVQLFIGAMTGLVLAGNFLQLYIFWEIVGICSAFLIAFWYDRPEAVRAGLKAFLVTRVGDAALLVGFLWLYVTSGTVDFQKLGTLASQGLIPATVLAAAGLLILVGAMGKSAQVPLHVWLPDAMEGPTTVSALIHAATMVNAGVYLVARTYTIFSYSQTWLSAVGWVGIISALLAASIATVTMDIKRVLAYSTISQLGIMFAALGTGTAGGWFASQFHLMSQGFFKALGFLAAGSIIHVLGTRNMDEMGGLRKRMPITFIAFLFSTLALAGVPPFVGFWSKDLVITELSLAGQNVQALLILVVSMLTSFYMFRALFKVFFGPESKMAQEKNIHESPKVMTIPLLILSACVLGLGFVESPAANLLGITENLAFELPIIGASLIAILIGLAPSYFAFYLHKPDPQAFLEHHSGLGALRRVMLAGYGFDAFYLAVFVRPLSKISSAVREFQTGILGKNLWPMLAVLAILVLWMVLYL